MSDQVHYELFVRATPTARWALELATEDRGRAAEAAEEALATGRVAAVKVTKETLDEETREFRSVTILTKGAPEPKRREEGPEKTEPLCVTPQDLYTLHARDRIGRLLEGWLARMRATPFELLHRPDLVEKLEAAGTDLQHALQKVAIPEAQARGKTVHEVIRTFHSLVDRAIDRLMKDHRKGVLPNLEKEGFAAACDRLMGEPEKGYLLGAGVAMHLAPATNWSQKVGRLLDLADQAPQDPGSRALAFGVVEQLLAEILGSKSGLAELLGDEMDLGSTLAAMIRLAGSERVEMIISLEPTLSKIMPALPGSAARLANWLDGPHFGGVRAAIAKRVLHELNGPRRLKPGDPEAEITFLRGLAMALTAAADRVISPDDIAAAFAARSRMLTASDFVEQLVGAAGSVREEIESLIRLAENVTGAAAKRSAAKWALAGVSALKFEREFRMGPDSPAAKLAALAALQKATTTTRLIEEDRIAIEAKIGEVGGYVEADAKLIGLIAKAPAPATQRLTLLLRMAAGEAAPRGPAADRAKAEALKIARSPDLREEVSRSPGAVAQVRDLMQTVILAA